jgi:hypothetical protein
MDEQEIIDTLRRGPVLSANTATGETKIDAMDDLPPQVRESIRASREDDSEHLRRYPDCLESEAQSY